MFKRVKPQAKPQDSDKVLVELWKAENEARKADGLPPVPYETWLEWYRWRQKQAKEGARL
jgi:hypothetical protein